MSDVDLKVEVVQRVVAAMVAGDPEEVLPLIDPAVEREAIGGMEPGVDRGVEQIVAGFGDYRRMWTRFEVEVEVIVVAGERVLALLRETGEGAGSGIEASLRSAVIFSIDAGRIGRIASYVDQARALADLGGLDVDPVTLERGAVYDLRDGAPVRRPPPG